MSTKEFPQPRTAGSLQLNVTALGSKGQSECFKQEKKKSGTSMSYSCPLAAGKNPFFTKIINQIKAFLYFILKYFKRDFLHFFNRLMTIICLSLN